MVALHRHSRLLAFGLLATLVYAAELLVVRSALPRSAAPDLLAAAVAFDLLVAVPALYWWLCVRGRASATRLVPVVMLSLIGASAVLPAASQGMLSAIRGLAVAAEVVVVGLIARRALRTVRSAADQPDLAEHIRQLLRPIVPHPRAADAAAYEVALLVYAFAGWRLRAPAGPDAFSIHRKSGYGGIALALGLVSVGEAGVVHLLLHGWSATAAWTLTAVSLYGVVWLLGDTQAIRLRPVRVRDDGLHVHVGLRWAVHVPWADVASLAPRGRQPIAGRAPGYLRATPMDEPRLVLELARPATALGPYGLTRTVSRIGLTVDDEARFLQAVAERLPAR